MPVSRPPKAAPEFSASNIFLNPELVFPFEVCISHFKDWRFWRYLLWYSIAVGRGGWITVENIKRICATLGLRYETERHAFSFAVEHGYATRGEGSRGSKSRGVYHFKSVAEVSRLCGLIVRKREPGGMAEKAQSLGDVVILTRNLLSMTAMDFKGLVAANGGKILCKKDAQQKRMLKRYWQQYREKGWWDNWVTDEETGERYLTQGTWEQLKEISHWKRDNFSDKIPLTGEEGWFSDVQKHIHPQKNNPKNLADCEVSCDGEVSTSRNSAELCIGPAPHISMAFCAAQFTRIDTTGHIVERTGYYSTVGTTSPLKLPSVKVTLPRAEMGRKRRKPRKIRTTSLEHRYRRFRFSSMGERDFGPKKVNASDIKHEYRVFVKPLSNRNIANVVGVSTNTVRNHAMRNFGGCAEMRKHVFVLGKEHGSTPEMLAFLNQRSKTLPHDLQYGASTVKTNTLRAAMKDGNTTISQLGLTEYVDMCDLGQNIAVLRPKSTFIFLEERKTTTFKRKTLNNTVKSCDSSVRSSAVAGSSQCPLGREKLPFRKAHSSSPQKGLIR